MDIGKVNLNLSSFYTGDQDEALSALHFAMAKVQEEINVAPGFCWLSVSVPIAVGKLVSITTGILGLADNTTGPKAAIGICVKAAANTGQKAGIILGMGYVSGLSGLTPNSSVYLGTAGGLVYAIPGAGLKQSIGYTLSATELFLTIAQPF